MDTLPLVLENIILDYKKDIELNHYTCREELSGDWDRFMKWFNNQKRNDIQINNIKISYIKLNDSYFSLVNPLWVQEHLPFWIEGEDYIIDGENISPHIKHLKIYGREISFTTTTPKKLSRMMELAKLDFHRLYQTLNYYDEYDGEILWWDWEDIILTSK
tara:strand:+ start:398 stop:877 length:480 start_codon:yes stop_codon:yes gene_type:complete